MLPGKTSRRDFFASIAAASAAAMTGCSAERLPAPPIVTPNDDTPQRGGTLRLALGEEVKTLDPARAIDQVSILAAQLTHDTLLNFAPADAPNPTALVPSLASSWSISNEGTTLQFEIRENARFSDGQALLAEDFVYGFDRLFAPETLAPMAQFFRGIDGAAERLEGRTNETRGVRALGPKTLEIRLSRPDPSFPLLLALIGSTPQKRTHVERSGTGIADKPLGTGPFVLQKRRRGLESTFERNPLYWNTDRIHLEGIVLREGVPRDTMLLEFLAGNLDILDGRICTDAVLFAREAAWAPYVSQSPLPITATDVMNTQRPPFTDKRVRQAFNYAVNKADTVRLANGRAMISNGYLPPNVPGHDASRRVWPYDPDRARVLLAEAGFAQGLEVTYTTLRDEMAQKIALSIQADLAAVGVRVNIETLTFAAYVNAILSGSLDFAFSSWSMDFPDPWNFLEVKFHGRMLEAGTNDARYVNPEVDRLLDAARFDSDAKRRLSLYQQAENIIVDDCPHIWHYFSTALDVRHPRVRGPIRHPTRDYSFLDTYLAKVT